MGCAPVGHDQGCVHSLGLGLAPLSLPLELADGRSCVVFADSVCAQLLVGYVSATHTTLFLRFRFPKTCLRSRSTLGSRSKGASFWSDDRPKVSIPNFHPPPTPPHNRQLQQRRLANGPTAHHKGHDTTRKPSQRIQRMASTNSNSGGGGGGRNKRVVTVAATQMACRYSSIVGVNHSES